MRNCVREDSYGTSISFARTKISMSRRDLKQACIQPEKNVPSSLLGIEVAVRNCASYLPKKSPFEAAQDRDPE
jgi:hypothetical protein